MDRLKPRFSRGAVKSFDINDGRPMHWFKSLKAYQWLVRPGASSIGCGMDDPTPKPSGMADAELLRAYQQTTRRSNDMVANALLAEIDRRNFDIL